MANKTVSVAFDLAIEDDLPLMKVWYMEHSLKTINNYELVKGELSVRLQALYALLKLVCYNNLPFATRISNPKGTSFISPLVLTTGTVKQLRFTENFQPTNENIKDELVIHIINLDDDLCDIDKLNLLDEMRCKRTHLLDNTKVESFQVGNSTEGYYTIAYNLSRPN